MRGESGRGRGGKDGRGGGEVGGGGERPDIGLDQLSRQPAPKQRFQHLRSHGASAFCKPQRPNYNWPARARSDVFSYRPHRTVIMAKRRLETKAGPLKEPAVVHAMDDCDNNISPALCLYMLNGRTHAGSLRPPLDGKHHADTEVHRTCKLDNCLTRVEYVSLSISKPYTLGSGAV